MKIYDRFTDPEAALSFGSLRDKIIYDLNMYLTYLGRKIRNMPSCVGDTFNYYFELYTKTKKDLEVQLAYKQLEARS